MMKKTMCMLGLAFLLVALATSVYAQCPGGGKDVKVMKVIKEGVGEDCCQMLGEKGPCGMGQACQCQQGMGMCQQGMGQMGMCCQGMGDCAGGCYLGCAKELGLTEDQIRGLKAIQMGTRKSAIRTQADLQIMEMELDEMLGQPNPDRAAIDAKMTAIGELRTKLEKGRVLAQLDARLLLSKEQLEKCKQGPCCSMGMMKCMEKESDMEKGGSPSKEGKTCGKHSEDGKK